MNIFVNICIAWLHVAWLAYRNFLLDTIGHMLVDMFLEVIMLELKKQKLMLDFKLP